MPPTPATVDQWDKAGFSDLKAMTVTKRWAWSPNGFDVYQFEVDGKDSKGQLAPAQCVERAVQDGVAIDVDLEELEAGEGESGKDSEKKPAGKGRKKKD